MRRALVFAVDIRSGERVHFYYCRIARERFISFKLRTFHVWVCLSMFQRYIIVLL